MYTLFAPFLNLSSYIAYVEKEKKKKITKGTKFKNFVKILKTSIIEKFYFKSIFNVYAEIFFIFLKDFYVFITLKDFNVRDSGTGYSSVGGDAESNLKSVKVVERKRCAVSQLCPSNASTKWNCHQIDRYILKNRFLQTIPSTLSLDDSIFFERVMVGSSI